jgi:hypothetical protein
MSLKSGMVAVIALVGLAALAAPTVVPVAHAGCMPGDRIDNTTAAEARHRIEAAGYDHVHDIFKGCDNYWHSTATKDGQTVFVGVSPQGEILHEGG